MGEAGAYGMLEVINTGQVAVTEPVSCWRCRYALGGFNGQSFLNTVEVYDPRADRWQMVSGVAERGSCGLESRIRRTFIDSCQTQNGPPCRLHVPNPSS